MMICYYFSFFIDEIWLDWQDNILFILFGRIKSDLQDMGLPSYPKAGLWDLVGQALILCWHQGAWISHGAHHFFGLGEWAGEPVFLTLSVAPQPLCTECVGKGCNSSRIGCGFHVSYGGWVN